MKSFFSKHAKNAIFVAGVLLASTSTAQADSPLYAKFNSDHREYPIFYSYEDCDNNSPYMVCEKFGNNPQCGIQLWSDAVPLRLAASALQAGEVVFLWYRKNSQQFCRIAP